MEPAALRALDALVRRLLGEPADPDLDALPTDLVRRHFLAPLAYTLGANQFRADHVTASLQAELRRKALLELTDALASAHIKVMLLKGVAYAGTIYPDPAARPMSDIDILVPADAIDAAGRHLQRLGYWQVGGTERWSSRHHAITFKRRGTAVDLHRHIVHLGRTLIDLTAVWRDPVPSHVAGALRPRPCHERLLHVAHMGRHEMIVPLVNYVDLHLLGPEPTDANAATAWGIRRSFMAAAECLDLLRGRSFSRRWWVPSKIDLLERRDPARLIQIARKFNHIDSLNGILGLLRATAEARVRQLGVIARTRS